MALTEVQLTPQPVQRFAPLVGEQAVRDILRMAEAVRTAIHGRRVWNVNSTAFGGGVAEMLRPLLSYARGAGIDARWSVIHGPPDFFRITKRLHNALHGEAGDRSPLGRAERALYEQVSRENALELVQQLRRGDIVLLHDPQTAGLAPWLAGTGASVVWRCHIGRDTPNVEVEEGWRFLLPYLTDVPLCVFSRNAYVPRALPRGRSIIVMPSIDPFSAKNQDLAPDVVHAILCHVGLLTCQRHPRAEPVYTRADGSSGRVEHYADIVDLGPPPPESAPLVVQVSRWDRLKDPVGVMVGFARMLEQHPESGAFLVLAGPNVHAVADDPDGAAVLDEVTGHWRGLPHETRHRVHLASLPTHDVEENAVIVNALQRHAAVLVQKSLHEGFGLTVTEAMWKGRPVVASAVGGIRDQIEDGVSGLLVHDPDDAAAFANLLWRALSDPELARTLGRNARETVRANFLGLRSLRQYAEIIQRLDAALLSAPPAEPPPATL